MNTKIAKPLTGYKTSMRMVKCAQRTCIEMILKSTETSKSFSRAEPEIKRDVNDALDAVRCVKK
jgi:hypothetical protein